MIAGMLGLFVTVAFLVVVIVAVAFRARFDWRIKAGLSVMTAVVLMICYFSLADLLGQPTPFRVSDDGMVLLHATVTEPDKTTNRGGAIYLWVQALSGDRTPRAISLPYSRAAHQRVVDALRRIGDGGNAGVRLLSDGVAPNLVDSFSVHDLHRPKPSDKAGIQ